MKPLLCLLVALLPGIALANIDQEWRFRVLIDDSEVGTHTFRVTEQSGERRVASDARFNVKLWFINAYTYTHQARERWRGECLEDIEARTDDNGALKSVRGVRNGASFEIDNAKLPGCVMSFAYWNPAMLKQTRLLNSQTGEFTDVRIESIGAETIQVRGESVSARRYALHAPKFRIDLWYLDDARWVRLESRTESGRMLRYFIQ